MSGEQMRGAIEAILFAMGNPVEISRIAYALETTEEEVEDCILDMMLEYKKEKRGIKIIRIEESVQICTKPEYYHFIKRIIDTPSQTVLTRIQMEVLTIVAYKQPVTKAEIDSVRGVDSFKAIGHLLESGMIEEKGRLGRRGSPIVYGTTLEFLKRFGMTSIEDLPEFDLEKMAEMELEVEDEIKSIFT